MEGPAFSSSQVSGIRCSVGSSRNAPGGEGVGRAAAKIAEHGKDGKDGNAAASHRPFTFRRSTYRLFSYRPSAWLHLPL